MKMLSPKKGNERVSRFSAIIAAFNQRDRLLDAVESVRRQSLPAREIIVVDDGGSDGSADAVRSRYPDVRVLIQENRGKGVARNHGAFVAQGEWVCFLDHDDLWHPDKLRSIDDYLSVHPGAIAVDHGVWIFREDANGPDTACSLHIDFTAKNLDDAIEAMNKLALPANSFEYLQRTGNAYDASLRRIFSSTSALCIRRDAFFMAGGFHPAHANGEDWALSTNVARIGEWHTLRKALSCFRYTPTSDSSDPAGMVMILATLVNQWYSGRPLREHTRGFGFLKDLQKYARENGHFARLAIWGSLRRWNLRGAGAGLWLSMLLLPRWLDRLAALIPPPLLWRFQRYVLRRHR